MKSLISIIVVILIMLFVALPLQFLWNWLMPDLFNLPTISFFQAFGLLILSNILFKCNTPSNAEELETKLTKFN